MRIIEPFRNYFWDFYKPLSKRDKSKVDYVLHIVISSERIPSKFFKHIEEGIYEIRIEVGGNNYRIFTFFEDNKLVILLHGIQKKSMKIPRKEILRAKNLRKEFYDEKKN